MYNNKIWKICKNSMMQIIKKLTIEENIHKMYCNKNIIILTYISGNMELLTINEYDEINLCEYDKSKDHISKVTSLQFLSQEDLIISSSKGGLINITNKMFSLLKQIKIPFEIASSYYSHESNELFIANKNHIYIIKDILKFNKNINKLKDSSNIFFKEEVPNILGKLEEEN